MSIEITLDICTPEGKTWLARITGIDPKFGLNREFVNAVERNTSRSGKTGTVTYVVEPGVYESNEGRRRYGRRFWIVDADGTINRVERTDALAAIEGEKL
jgi:hypothetical protein